MTPEQFEALKASGYNRIPVSCELLADLDTPLSVYLKLVNGPFGYLLESVEGGEKWGRYSIIGLPCEERLVVRGHAVTIEKGQKVLESLEVEDPLRFIETFAERFRVPELEDLPRFHGGLVGYFGYDTITYIQPRLGAADKPDALNTPDILLMVSGEVVVFDNLRGRIFVVVTADIDQGDTWQSVQTRMREISEAMRAPLSSASSTKPPREIHESDFISGFSEAGFKSAVNRVKQYILDGDCMQVVLSQRLSVPFYEQPMDLYRALRSLNPSPYLYFMDMDDFQIVGSSPEILVRLEEGEVTVRPIAGTRPRGRNDAEDKALEQELLADPKERAEHLMLIDLGRNDVGRVAEVGAVEVTQNMTVERYSHVMHIVSNVTGRVKPNMGAIDVLRATFPAGTVSGAPKVRAMEIIEELEPVKRGIYSGAVGYLAWNGNMDTAIAIRTAVVKDAQVNIQAGAGIVADSDPNAEWEETLNKGRAIFRAVALAEAGLDVPISDD